MRRHKVMSTDIYEVGFLCALRALGYCVWLLYSGYFERSTKPQFLYICR